jgi:predicted acylesterase/phospholipase RssA
VTARPPSPTFDPKDIARFCDVVMKGGVTSGIVYPRALCHLATQFNLRNIGGTSVGAIAASIAAAAEYQRRETGSGAGYEALDALPTFLSRGDSLIKLFAADKVAAPLLNIAMKLIGGDPLWQRLIRAVLAAATRFWWVAIVVALVAYVFQWAPLSQTTFFGVLLHAVIPAILLLALFAVGAVAAALVRCYIVLTNNDYGFCHAYSAAASERFKADLERLRNDGEDVTALQPADTPPLFNWLEAFIAHAAGRKLEDPPLTIGDLRTAKFPDWFEDDGAASIDFQTVTTCLTLSRPYGLPFNSRIAGRVECTPDRRPDRPTLYFTEPDLLKYFSPQIVDHLKRTGDVVRDDLQESATNFGIGPIYALPTGDELPVVVAVRLSMSFPILFCAVRLWGGLPGKAEPQPIWFSDGGLSSNFPIHLFDSPLARWPTFALDLLDNGTMQVMDGDEVVTPIPPTDAFLESEQPGVPLECSYPLSGKRGSLLQFLSSMIDAMRTWQDTTLGALPGNTSRTIGIRLPSKEGGLNLNMTPPQIGDLIARGDLAGQTLLREFAVGPTPNDTPSWRQQRWWRYLATMQSTIRWTQLFQKGYTPHDWLKQDTYEDLSENNFTGSTNKPELPEPAIRWDSCDQAKSAVGAAMAFDNVLISDVAAASFADKAPVPEAALRQRAPL